MSEPDEIVAGNSYAWSREFSEFPASSWNLVYHYVNDKNAYNVTGVPNGNAFDMTLTSAESALWVPGSYKWFALADQVVSRYTAASGEISVYPDIGAGPVDTRSQLERILEDLKAAYEDITKKGALEVSVSVGDRAVTFRTRADVWTEIQRVQYEIRQERIAAGLEVSGPVRIRLG